MEYDVIIIGGGAAAVACALSLDKKYKICIIEKEDRILKKLLVTGNGRCNLSNQNIKTDFYNADQIKNILLSSKEMGEFFDSLGLLTQSIDGRIYPYSLKASGVVSLFCELLKKREIDIILEEEILEVGKSFAKSKNKVYKAKSIVLSTGSKAGSREDARGGLIFSDKYTTKAPEASLVNIVFKDNILKGLKGTRASVKLSLCSKNKTIYEEEGEIIFKENGISGIPALNCSSYIARDKSKEFDLCIDFLPTITHDEIKKIRQTNDKMFAILNKNLFNNIDSQKKDFKKYVISKVSNGKIVDCQVISGGIKLENIDLSTLSSKMQKNLYFCGEVLDIDGLCGGYNLHWAFSSGIFVAKSINKRGTKG